MHSLNLIILKEQTFLKTKIKNNQKNQQKFFFLSIGNENAT